jgi:sec-independent protein translocase protein TatA
MEGPAVGVRAVALKPHDLDLAAARQDYPVDGVVISLFFQDAFSRQGRIGIFIEAFKPILVLSNALAANLRALPGGRRMFRNPLIDVIVVVIVALLIFGPKRLPMLGRALGQGLREFKEGITGESKSGDEPPALAPAPSESTPEPAAATPVAPSSVGGERESAEAGSSERPA